MHKGLVWVCIVTAGLLAGCGGGGGGGNAGSSVTPGPASGGSVLSMTGTVSNGSTPVPNNTEVTATDPSSAVVCAVAYTDGNGNYVLPTSGLSTTTGCTNPPSVVMTAPTIMNAAGSVATNTCIVGPTPCNLSPTTTEQIHPFVGTWHATYTGSSSGNCTISVLSTGAIQQASCTQTLPTSQPFTLSGVLQTNASTPNNGTFSGNAQTGAAYNGTFVLSGGGGAVNNGTWSNKTTNPPTSGTWNATFP